MPQSAVGEVYVTVKPDTKGFAAALQSQLAALTSAGSATANALGAISTNATAASKSIDKITASFNMAGLAATAFGLDVIDVSTAIVNSSATAVAAILSIAQAYGQARAAAAGGIPGPGAGAGSPATPSPAAATAPVSPANTAAAAATIAAANAAAAAAREADRSLQSLVRTQEIARLAASQADKAFAAATAAIAKYGYASTQAAAAIAKATEAQQRAAGASAKASAAFGAANPANQRLATDIQDAAEAARKLAAESANTGNSMSNAANSGAAAWKQTATAVSGVFAALVGVSKVVGAVVGGFSEVFDTYRKVDIGLTGILGSGARAASVLQEIRDLAVISPYQTNTYYEFTQRLLAVGLAAKQVVPLLTQVTDIVAATGGEDREIKIALNAISQVQTAGRLLGNDSLQLLAANIPIYQLISTYLGKTTAEVRKLGEAGSLSAETVFAAIALEGKSVEGAAKNAVNTIKGAKSVFQDTIQQTLIVPNVDITRVYDGIVNAFKSVIDFVSSAEFKEAFDTAAKAMGDLFDALSPAIGALGELGGTIVIDLITGLGEGMSFLSDIISHFPVGVVETIVVALSFKGLALAVPAISKLASTLTGGLIPALGGSAAATAADTAATGANTVAKELNIKTIGVMAGKVALLAGAIIGYNIASDGINEKNKTKAIGGGILSGASTGALVGSSFGAPGVVVGAAVGTLVGGLTANAKYEEAIAEAHAAEMKKIGEKTAANYLAPIQFAYDQGGPLGKLIEDTRKRSDELQKIIDEEKKKREDLNGTGTDILSGIGNALSLGQYDLNAEDDVKSDREAQAQAEVDVIIAAQEKASADLVSRYVQVNIETNDKLKELGILTPTYSIDTESGVTTTDFAVNEEKLASYKKEIGLTGNVSDEVLIKTINYLENTTEGWGKVAVAARNAVTAYAKAAEISKEDYGPLLEVLQQQKATADAIAKAGSTNLVSSLGIGGAAAANDAAQARNKAIQEQRKIEYAALLAANPTASKERILEFDDEARIAAEAAVDGSIARLAVLWDGIDASIKSSLVGSAQIGTNLGAFTSSGAGQVQAASAALNQSTASVKSTQDAANTAAAKAVLDPSLAAASAVARDAAIQASASLITAQYMSLGIDKDTAAVIALEQAIQGVDAETTAFTASVGMQDTAITALTTATNAYTTALSAAKAESDALYGGRDAQLGQQQAVVGDRNTASAAIIAAQEQQLDVGLQLAAQAAVNTAAEDVYTEARLAGATAAEANASAEQYRNDVLALSGQNFQAVTDKVVGFNKELDNVNGRQAVATIIVNGIQEALLNISKLKLELLNINSGFGQVGEAARDSKNAEIAAQQHIIDILEHRVPDDLGLLGTIAITATQAGAGTAPGKGKTGKSEEDKAAELQSKINAALNTLTTAFQAAKDKVEEFTKSLEISIKTRTEYDAATSVSRLTRNADRQASDLSAIQGYLNNLSAKGLSESALNSIVGTVGVEDFKQLRKLDRASGSDIAALNAAVSQRDQSAQSLSEARAQRDSDNIEAIAKAIVAAQKQLTGNTILLGDAKAIEQTVNIDIVNGDPEANAAAVLAVLSGPVIKK